MTSRLRFILRNWWRDWAIFDLTIPIIAVGLAYFLQNNGFWLNLSTELIGAYISLRFIGFILGRTQERHRRRKELVGNINWFYESADKLVPHFDEWRIKELSNEIKHFDERWEKRKKLLDIDEITLVEEIRQSRKKIITLSENYVRQLRLVNECEKKLEGSLNLLGIRLDLREMTTKPFHDYTNALINADEYYGQLEKLLKSSSKKKALKNLSPFGDYVTEVKKIVNTRQNLEVEVAAHERLVSNLRLNVYQESGSND